ncbi:hypothetical protein [Roseinatronobacter bogoriensis]|uniref:HIRAN domain-containing protein n=1 Tax=Roseinatronobacter bogoriensis subsp. barguzinensis TaxID=441209 RepID=A0A2K8KGJ8_9RHOB|nr:hypothetical protein [Rhodobaca]ATX67113.1 hypothetical protein BG454_15875 [Rhodobaca barguzinensis]MBB4206629.1 hypothetical protein [Rhodobaca bogoriensis DSM 18756]TDW41373.1 hypothetical protein LY39_00476 [Rhodobaca barguzinensis]TDY74449.1 hypothetical protein EV660_101489 [Rhodobaca bogoriensis DSM 18756]
MQALIHQTRIDGLQFAIQGSGVTLGQDVALEYDQQNRVAAFVKLPARWSFGFSRNKRKQLGYLGPDAAMLITPALERQAPLRVRIVELEPAHAREEGIDQVSVSIWGRPSDLQPLTQEQSVQPQAPSED